MILFSSFGLSLLLLKVYIYIINCGNFCGGIAEKIKDRSSGAVADDLYHRYKVYMVWSN